MRRTTWVVTLVATVVSAYVLDAIAALAGVGLVASGLLGDAGRGPLLVFLGATYIVWAAGLRAGLRANGALLAETGTSTNLLSKLAYDLTAARTTRLAARRLAAGAGYVGTEVAKEVPYYLGAFGAALTDTVSGGEAIVFLGGANLGAAVYELGLARLTRILLRTRSTAGRRPCDPSPR
jgi:hypothetical protein